MKYCTTQLSNEKNFSISLAETGLCDLLEMQRYFIKFMINAEYIALKTDTYDEFLEKNKGLITCLQNYTLFNSEVRLYDALNAKLQDYKFSEYQRIMIRHIERSLSKETGVRVLSFDNSFVFAKLQAFYLLYERGYFTYDTDMKQVLDNSIKYEWPRILEKNPINPLTKIYLNFVRLDEQFYERLRADFTMSLNLMNRLMMSPPDLRMFLLKHRGDKGFIPTPATVEDETRQLPKESDIEFGGF